MQNIDLRNKSYKQFLVKTKVGQLEKNLILTLFSIEICFGLLLQVSKHSMS